MPTVSRGQTKLPLLRRRAALARSWFYAHSMVLTRTPERRSEIFRDYGAVTWRDEYLYKYLIQGVPSAVAGLCSGGRTASWVDRQRVVKHPWILRCSHLCCKEQLRRELSTHSTVKVCSAGLHAPS